MEKLRSEIIEQMAVVEILRTAKAEPLQHASSIALQLAGVSMDFARVERVPRYADSRRESDVEHSFMLSLVATELAQLLYADRLDVGLVNQYGGVHDLIELRTDDVATFSISPEELAAKEKAEHDALEGLIQDLPPYTGGLLRAYEAQADPESRFVRAVDKLLPVLVDILGDGMRVMTEDYDVHSSDQLADSHISLHSRIRQRFSEFPEIVDAHALLCELFEEEAMFEAPEEQLTLSV